MGTAFVEALHGASEYHKRRSVINIMIMNQGRPESSFSLVPSFSELSRGPPRPFITPVPHTPSYAAITILFPVSSSSHPSPRLKLHHPASHQSPIHVVLPCFSRTHLLVLSLYNTRCPHSLHLIGSPRFSGTLLLQSPHR